MSAEDKVTIKNILLGIEKEAREFLLRDRYEIHFRLKAARRRLHAGQPVDRIVQKLQLISKAARGRKLKDITETLTVHYPEALPVSRRSADIKKLIIDNQVVIVCGSTGSGKTTQLPKIALEAGGGRLGRIGCTQPRRLAATAMARRVAAELDVASGAEVGYQVRFDDRTCDKTVIKFMTDGILLAETRNDPDLLQYETLIIDEAHERSLNIDFILGYLKKLLSRRPELRVIISSATLDAENFAKFFDDAPVVTVEGRTFPVEDYFLPVEKDEELSAHIARAVNWISEIDHKGDILVFLPGEREIRDAGDLLTGRRLPETEILPLYGRLSMSEQQRVFNPGDGRRIILATNVAETSVTIPGIHYVIDSGQVRLSRYNPRTQIQELQIEQVSRASARQRRGRCGRIAEGICVHLYSEEAFEAGQEFTDPEIRRTSLAGVILQMAMLKLPRIEHFPFIDPPQMALVREGYRALRDIRATDERGRITESGRKIARLPLDPHLAKMVCEAEMYKVFPEVTAIATYLSIQDPRERPVEQQQAADQAHRQWMDRDSDYIGIINLWNFLQEQRQTGMSNSGLRRFCRRNFINYKRIREWLNLAQDIADSAAEINIAKARMRDCLLDAKCYDAIHKAVLSGIPDHIGMFDSEEMEYIGTRERKFHLFPGSCLFNKKEIPKWVMTFALVSTTRIFARQNAEIKPEWVEEVAPHLCRTIYDNVHWNSRAGFVYARERVSSGGLLIHDGRRVHYGAVKPFEAREVFLREGVVPGNLFTRARWLKKHRRMIQQIKTLEAKIRRPDTVWDPDAVYLHFDKLLPEDINSVKSLEKWLRNSKTDICMEAEDAMQELFTPVNWSEFPDELDFSGHEFRLKYRFNPGESGDGVSVITPEAELNLISASCLEWGVPGLLAEKVEYLIKSLPKSLRRYCNPAAATAKVFKSEFDKGVYLREQSLLQVLAEFLSEYADITVKSSDFKVEKVPDCLNMKIALCNAEGKIQDFTEDIPAGAGSQLSGSVNGAGEWLLDGLSAWPSGDVPDKISLGGAAGRDGYPALVDEGSTVGRQVFLDQREAELQHDAGLFRLFALQYGSLIKYLKTACKLPREAQLTLFMDYDKKSFTSDFVFAVIRDALTDCGQIDIRNAGVFEQRVEVARCESGELATKRLSAIEDIAAARGSVEQLLRKAELSNVGEDSIADMKEQLQFLFRPGFVLEYAVWLRYPRYLKALRVRSERMISAPFKDREKMRSVELFSERFRLALQMVDNFNSAFELKEFWLLLEEFRIAVFAPEVKPLEKVSEKRLQKKWDDLRI
ncbi:ATP-dependent RNA helicase HrpA [Lentisphaerota bacterium ZTH]|nr:ATP-dependent RNA helicase HrpA [Lentisphaerota bacterium]WET05313.1 ATP-dependent RNA helicase HrpA [Lentisphaerota bacterium ZTH]